MRDRELERRRSRDADAAPREPEPPAAEAAVLGLQRAAGNRAVTALLARQPAPTKDRPPPAREERGATTTLGLGDDIGVIPLESATWGQPVDGQVRDLHVSFLADNPIVPKIQQAVAQGRPIPKGFFSTTGATARMTGIVLTAFSMGPAGPDSGAVVTLTVNFETIEFEGVR